MELFDDLDDISYRTLADHARLTEYLPMSLIATVTTNHPYIYVILEVCLCYLRVICHKKLNYYTGITCIMTLFRVMSDEFALSIICNLLN